MVDVEDGWKLAVAERDMAWGGAGEVAGSRVTVVATGAGSDSPSREQAANRSRRRMTLH